MNTKSTDNPERVLRQWRAKILKNFLIFVAIAATVMAAASILDAISRPGQWPAVIVFAVLDLVLIALAVMRVDYRIQAWGILLVPYAVAVITLASFGLGSSGRLYLLVLPIGALILIGVRSGIIMSALSIITVVVFSFLAKYGVLSNWLIADRNSLLMADWLAEFTDTVMLLAIIMTLLILFYRFQERLISKERRTQVDLLHAHTLLEQQNVTLEQKIQERTGELQASNLSLEQRNTELAIINSVQEGLASKLDGQAIYELIGEKVREVFNVQAINIVTYDPTANLISMPYSYEKGDRSVVSPREPYGFRLHVINTCAPLLINQNFVELASQYNNPVIAGTCPKSALFVPLLVDGKVRGIISIQDLDRENAYSASDVHLLQTLAIAMSVAIENARLFAEIKRQEQHAQEMQRRMADIINFLPDATLVIDHEGKVIAWNHAMEEMTGVPAKDMLGKGDREYALPFYGERRPILIDLVSTPQQELEQKYATIKREGTVLAGETYVSHLKGGGVYLSAAASALSDSKGDPAGAIEVIRDLTERKHMEEDLHQAKEAAEAATQAKSAFLATMSHEIRTPMNAVIGMTGLLLDTTLTAEQREFAETIRTSGDALLTIINDILDFSKIEAGRMELESQPFDLRSCVESAVDLLASRATEKGLDVGCFVESDVPAAIVGDVTRLRQVLVNLLGNAVKFTEHGEVILSVSREIADERAREDVVPIADPSSPLVTLRFSIRDTGIGIPPDRQGRLFLSFSQIDASTTRRFGGTGLGLAISKRLTELMGGRIWVESEGVAGKGSTFHFTVRAETAQPLAPRPYLQGIQPHLEGRRALIVDDNATNRHILALQTRAWGMSPLDTGSPIEALAWIRRGDPFDVALLDLQMPEMDGMMLAGEIRQHRTAGQLPIVMLSSLGPREARLEGIELAAYLLKPVKPSQLYNALVGIFAVEEVVVPADTAAGPHLDAEMGKRHPLSILLAEDHAINQKLALLVLERLGYRADVAGNGEEVLQALRRQHYDAILMDVQMPEMDGLEATRVIVREFSGERRPRIIAMTANAMKEDRDECFAAGMDDFITKPIKFDELMAALNKCQARALTELGGRLSPGTETPVPIPPAARTVEAGRQANEQPPLTLDPAALQRLRTTLGKQADAMLPGLIDSFFEDAPRLITDAHRTLEQGQATDLRRAAHTLKSSSATFGALALSILARDLEYRARDGCLDGAGELLTRIETEYEKAKAALQVFQKEM